MADNHLMRALLTLPPIPESASRVLALPEQPPKRQHTGDPEIDAVLWLQEVVQTGSPVLVAKALESAKLIKTPMKVLGERYAKILQGQGAHGLQVMFATIRFGELESQAKRAIEKAKRKHEALARFGSIDALFAKTPAEAATKKALRGIKRNKKWDSYDQDDAALRFRARPDLAPHTLADCIHAQRYADELYSLRSASADAGDHWPAFQAYDDYAFHSMATIPPRSRDEALQAFDFLIADDALGRTGAKDVLRNLIAGDRA